jgi:hypothetical protein
MAYTKEQREANAAKSATAGPVMAEQPTRKVIRPMPAETKAEKLEKKLKKGWCKFAAENRCYVEGVQLEGDQTITLSPAAAYRQSKNKNLRLVEGEIVADLSKDEIEALEDGEPSVTETAYIPDGQVRLIKQA